MIDEREEPMDETITRAAAEYHAPPAVPRELMWERIATARHGGGGAVTADAERPAPGTGGVIPIRRRWARVMGPVGIAALIALAFGVGRMSVDGDSVGSAVADRGAAAGETVPGVEAPRVDRTPAEGGESAARLAAGDPAAASEIGGPAPVSAPASQQRNSSVAPPSGVRLAANSPVSPYGLDTDTGIRLDEPEPDGTSRSLALVARQHLAQAETFLTLFRASVQADSAVEPIVPATARQLLATNRLLMDTDAADDPALRRLLGDVELVLAQITQLPADPTRSADRQWINDGIEQRDLLLRIRAAADDPSGLPVPGVL